MIRPFYSNIERARKYLSMASQNTTDDEQLFAYLGRASRSIDRYTRRHFYPLRETRFFDYKDARAIRLDDDLLTLETLKTMNGACTIASPTMLLETGNNYNNSPYDRIVLRYNSGSLFLFSGTDEKANEVTGFWGYNEDYANAWVDTGASLSTSYVSGAGSMGISGASTGTGASDANYEAPRMAIGDTLMIEGEMLFVTAGNGSIVNIIPHISGTSANNHAASTAIYRYSPEPDIQWATEKLAAWLYGQSMTPYETKTAFVSLGTLSIPQSIAVDVKDKIDRYINRTLMVYPDGPNAK